MQNSAVFKLELVILTGLALMACGPRNKAAKPQETTFIENAGHVERSTKAGVLGCDGRYEAIPQDDISIPKLEVVVPGSAQKVLRKPCQGDYTVYVEFQAVELDLKVSIGATDADIIVVRNRTTCTERTRNFAAEQATLKNIDPAQIRSINLVDRVAVLPVGDEMMEPPQDLSLDPTRANLIEIELQKCEKWTMEGDLKVCANAIPTLRKQLNVSVTLPPRYHRGVRSEKLSCQ